MEIIILLFIACTLVVTLALLKIAKLSDEKIEDLNKKFFSENR